MHSFSLDILCTLFPWTGKDSRFGTLLAEVHSAEIPRCEPPTTTEVDLSGGREVVPLGCCVACDVGSHRDEVPHGPRKVYADMDPGLSSPSNSAVASASDNAPGLETIVLSNPRLSSREPATSLVYVPSRGFTRLYSLSRAKLVASDNAVTATPAVNGCRVI